jgi:hypothetical protein
MKYELIKKYPGSPKLGSIAIPTTTDEKCSIFYILESESETVIKPFNFPEFWQKGEEVDYEILTVTPSDKNLNNTNKEAVITFKMCNKDLQMWNVHSVKRLSDGEVFTVGDEITLYDEVSRKTLYKITEFAKMADTIQVIGEGEGRAIFYRLKSIEKLSKKTPLFTTEDGVDIFEGDDYFVVNHEYEIKKFTVCGGPFTFKNLGFSSKEKAEEYILMNKPCLSLNETKKLFKTSSILKFEQKLIELAKSKL